MQAVSYAYIHFTYIHIRALSHKHIQCAHTDVLEKPAHGDYSHVCSPQPSIPHSLEMYITKHTILINSVVLSHCVNRHPLIVVKG